MLAVILGTADLKICSTHAADISPESNTNAWWCEPLNMAVAEHLPARD